MAGTTFVTQAGFEVGATTSFATRVTTAALQAAVTTSFASRVTQAAFNVAVWTSFRTRVTQIGFNVWVLYLGSSSIPAGTVIPPDGTTTDHLTATDECCPGLWTAGDAPCPGWVDGSAPSTSWTSNDC